MSKITFQITKPRRWLGNGMGYDCAEWLALEGSKPIATIINYSFGWKVHWTDGRKASDALTLVEAKAIIRQ